MISRTAQVYGEKDNTTQLQKLLAERSGKQQQLSVPKQSLKGQLKRDNLQKDSKFFTQLQKSGKAKWTSNGWTLFQRRQTKQQIDGEKTKTVLNRTATPKQVYQNVQEAATIMGTAAQDAGFLQPGAIQMRKKMPLFFGRWVDNRGYVRQLPKGNRNMFNTSTRQGKLQYDAWMMTNAWNKFANYYAQYKKDQERNDTQIKNIYNDQLSKIAPAHASMQNMLNWLRVGQHKLSLPKYAVTDKTLLPAITKAAKQQDWDKFLTAKRSLAAAIIQQTDWSKPQALARASMGKALGTVADTMGKNYTSKKEQGVTTLKEKRTVKDSQSTYISNAQNAKPSQFPTLKPNQFAIPQYVLQYALKNLSGRQGKRHIAVGKMWRGAKGQQGIDTKITGNQSSIMRERDQQQQSVFEVPQINNQSKSQILGILPKPGSKGSAAKVANLFRKYPVAMNNLQSQLLNATGRPSQAQVLGVLTTAGVAKNQIPANILESLAKYYK